jgi:hypothetical protein
VGVVVHAVFDLRALFVAAVQESESVRGGEVIVERGHPARTPSRGLGK